MVKFQVHRSASFGQGQPGLSGVGGRAFAAQWALLAAAIVGIVPIMAFILAAAIVGIVVFMVAAMIFRVVAAVRRVFQGSSSHDDLTQPGYDGRVNVRVVRDRS